MQTLDSTEVLPPKQSVTQFMRKPDQNQSVK